MPPGELSGGVPGMASGQEIVRQSQDTMKGFTLPSSPGEAETATAAECNRRVGRDPTINRMIHQPAVWRKHLRKQS